MKKKRKIRKLKKIKKEKKIDLDIMLLKIYRN